MVELSSQFGSPYMTKGGQGKLFSDPKPVAQHRYQRGYTPERMADIRAQPIDIHTPEPEPQTASPGAKDTESRTPFTGHGAARRVQEVMARSTMPTSHIGQEPADTAARVAHMGPDAKVGPDDVYPLRISTGRNIGASGTYQSGTNWARGLIKIGAYGESEQTKGQTLMHELGHHYSHKVVPSSSNEYRTPSQIGREEAKADDYSVTHYRPDPRDVRRGTAEPNRSVYESKEAFYGGSGGQAAHRAYLAGRETLKPEEKATIRRHGFRPMSRQERGSEPFVHETTGEHWSPAGPDRDWHVQGALFNDRRGNPE
jgi:hypothetical protein